MSSFNKDYISSIRFHPATTFLLNQCSEARGMQEMWKKVRPEVLQALRESAIIQSAESSNRIEGVEVEKQRLIPLVLGQTKPRDRSEEEIVGYRKALNHIHKNYQKIEIVPAAILKLHELAQGGLIGDAGEWKKRDNEIIEFSASGERSIRFRPIPAKETPKAIEQLCLGFRDLSRQNQLPDLISIASFVLDFLCIHPFRDGNGRVSRLLTLLLLYQSGFEVGRYMSLERIVEETKEDYYRVLKESSDSWHSSGHNLMPWWNYFLGVIRSAYQDLKTRVELSSAGDSKSALIRQAIMSQEGSFSVLDICNALPSLDRELVKKVIYAMREEKLLKLLGQGRGARWIRVRDPSVIF